MQQQVAFLNEKIDEEEQKEGIYAMRITSIAELSKFEKELMRVKSQQKANPSLDETLKSDRPSRVSIDIHETDIESVAFVM